MTRRCRGRWKKSASGPCPNASRSATPPRWISRTTSARCWPGTASAEPRPSTVAPAVANGPGDHPSLLAIPIVPRGLRSFEADDADFFLQLLPGPRDRFGLPQVLRFWKSRIEETDPETTLRVGLIYGPSGCGKSSLVKAGLLPRLADRVVSVFVEAAPGATEARLGAAIRKSVPGLPAELPLSELLAAIRRGQSLPPGRKLLLVLDQFEQWLHAHPAPEGTELVETLRQCDGTRVQAVVIVRDDFWMSVTSFFRELDVHLADGQNSAGVDRFDTRHARKVLTAFGRAFGALPPARIELTKEQLTFVNQAVDGLAHEGMVSPVQLSLFAEMVKGRAWTPATLRASAARKESGSRSSRRHSPARRRPRSIGCTSAQARGPPAPAPRPGPRDPRAHAPVPGAAGGVGLRRPARGLRGPDADPRHRAPADHADRPLRRPDGPRRDGDRAALPAHARLPRAVAARMAGRQAEGESAGAGGAAAGRAGPALGQSARNTAAPIARGMVGDQRVYRAGAPERANVP